MNEVDIEQASYPTGRYASPESYTARDVEKWINKIEALPSLLDPCIENMDEGMLNTPYRPGGWNSQQVIHHIADTHMNAYVRTKMTLTEDTPTIAPYDENLWAVMADTETVPVNISITLVHALHRRWVALLRSLQPTDWNRTYYHPEYKIHTPLWKLISLYAWHGHHHMEQLRGLRNRMNWW